MCYIIFDLYVYVNVREYRRGNQKRQSRETSNEYGKQDEDKQNIYDIIS